MINIISTFYISKYKSNLDFERSKELESCIINNINSNFIEKIHLFVDDNDALNRLKIISNNSDKIVIISIGIKPKYNDFFKYIIDNLKDNICMITNADIYLYECDLKLIQNLKNEKLCYALTRYEHNMSHPLIDNYCGSHDSYIFNSKFINYKIINEHTNFYQNFPGIESHIIKNFCDSEVKVLNPCKQIKIVHLHKTQLRNHGIWIGLHKSGDYKTHMQSVWWVPPIVLYY
jgi:hypothetical protein